MPAGARTLIVLLAARGLLAPGPLPAQAPDTLLGRTFLRRPALPLPNGEFDQRLRLLEDLGRAPLEGRLLRSPSTLVSAPQGFTLVPPRLRTIWNDRLPDSRNEGALWAGRGLNWDLIAGARLHRGRWDVVVAPELTHASNLATPVLPPGETGRSVFQPDWQRGRQSADLPIRFGDRPLTQILPGQTTVAYRASRWAFGVSSENQWWGPGVQNALVMSSNAAGFPHLFVRTAAPVATPLGSLEGRWLLGGLTESLYFDTVSTNDLRSLSGVAVALRPAAAPGLALGLARVVYGRVPGASALPGHALDALLRWNQSPRDTLGAGRSEQLLSLFGRWVFPRDGAEVYAEWARVALPTSLRDLLVAPDYTQGYTLGAQWARPLANAGALRLQGEVSYLEESAAFAQAPGHTFYTSPAVPQGYTERGKVIGAAIGPGGSSQSLTLDFFSDWGRLGLYAGRVRWNDDAYYRLPAGRLYLAHDVSAFLGLRVGLQLRYGTLSLDYSAGKRYNYLFQNPSIGLDGEGALDVSHRSLRLTLVPLLGR